MIGPSALRAIAAQVTVRLLVFCVTVSASIAFYVLSNAVVVHLMLMTPFSSRSALVRPLVAGTEIAKAAVHRDPPEDFGLWRLVSSKN